MEYTVSLSRYEGPYTKLLDLIDSRKLSITEIDLASLADDYVSYTRSLEKKDHLDMSLFLVVASTLMLMKVRSLLPQVDYTDTEEKQVNDLKKKLELLATLKKGVRTLEKSYGALQFYSPHKLRLKRKESTPPKNLTPESLIESALALVRAGEKRSFVKEVSIKQTLPMETVRKIMQEKATGKTSLRQIAKDIPDEKALIVVFLSLLELIRQSELLVFEETETDIIFGPCDVVHS